MRVGTKRGLSGLILLCMASALPLACGGIQEKASEKIAEKVIEKGIEAQAKKDGEDVDVDIDIASGRMSVKGADGTEKANVSVQDGKVSVTTEEGNQSLKIDGDKQTFTMTSPDGSVVAVGGENTKLPDDFPKDVPLYPGATLLSTIKSPEQGMFMIQAQTADALDKVSGHFKNQLTTNGWTEMQTMTQSGETAMVMLNWMKDERMAMVTLISEDGQTHISITTGNK